MLLAVMLALTEVAAAAPSGPLWAVPADAGADGRAAGRGGASGGDGAVTGAPREVSRRAALAEVPAGRPAASVPARRADVPVPVARPVPRVGRVWPVGTHPTVVRGWDPPAVPYGPGHRGIDLAAGPGAPVLAVAPGRVVFAGRVGGHGVVSVNLVGTGFPALRTTYSGVRATVDQGDEVSAGQVVAVLEPAFGHCADACLHWGLRRADSYFDPLSLMPPGLLHPGPSRLLPVSGVPEES